MPKPAQRRMTPTAPRIVDVRNVKVVVDEDLARLYRVTTARLNQSVTRNAARFPADFAFRVSDAAHRILKSQFVISSGSHGGRRSRPRVFTEHGAIMAATVLRSEGAIEMSIFVVRAFLRLRDVAVTHSELAAKLAALKQRVTGHDGDLKEILVALRKLIAPTPRQRRQIGFRSTTVLRTEG